MSSTMRKASVASSVPTNKASRFVKIAEGKPKFSDVLPWSNKAWGIIFLLLGSVFNAVDSIMFDIASDGGFSSNALTLYGSICSLLGALALDAFYYYKIGYRTKNQGVIHWFVFFDIWKKDQRNKMFSIPHYLQWFFIFCISNFCNAFFLIISYVFADNIGDSIAIYDMYPVLIPFFGICIVKRYGTSIDGFEWKNVYIFCFILSVIALVFLAKPGFVFGYSKDTNVGDQLIAVLMALFSAVFAALYVVSNTMIETLAQWHSNSILNNSSSNIGYNSVSGIELDDFEGGNVPAATGSLNSSSKSNNNNNNNNINNNNGSGLADINENRLMGRGSKTAGDNTEYIICNEMALVTVSVEYASLVTIGLCFVFSLLGLLDDPDRDWLWGEFRLFKSDNFSDITKGSMWYAFGASFVWLFDYYFYTFGIFKLRNATLAGLLDVSDVFFGFVLSYIWLHESADAYDIIGALFIVLAIVVSIIECKSCFGQKS